MTQGTTPLLLWSVNANLTGAQVIVLSIRQNGRLYNFGTERNTVASASSTESVAAVHLTQEETLALKPGACSLQVTWIDATGERHTTNIVGVEHLEALFKEVIDVD